MALVERYLQAVRFWLPKAQRQGILDELAGDLRGQIEDRESELGRSLDQSEVEALLTRCGHPRLVAERYLPQRYLIGPALLPVYTFVLKLIGLVYLLPWLFVWMGFLVFDPTYRVEHGVRDGLIAFWLQTVHIFAVVTVLVAVTERQQLRLRLLETWNVHTWFERRPAPPPDEIQRSESLVELVFGALLLVGWLRLAGTPMTQLLADGVRVTFWPLDSRLFWLIALLLTGGIVMAIVNLWRPWWTRPRAMLVAGVNAAGLLLVCLVAASGPVVDVAVLDPRTARANELAWWLNLAWMATLAIIGVGFLLRCARGVRRSLRPRQATAEIRE